MPYWVAMEGVYNKFSTVQHKIYEESKEFLLDNINRLKVNKERPVFIADLGCSHGKNSVAMMGFILRSIMNKPELINDVNNTEFLVYHEDQSLNDWNSLFNTILSHESYATNMNNAYVSVINKSFYNRLFPSKYIDFFVSYLALHWLDHIPPTLPGNRIAVRLIWTHLAV